MSARRMMLPDCVALNEVWSVGEYPGRWLWTYELIIDNTIHTPAVVLGSSAQQRTWTKKSAALKNAQKLATHLGLPVKVPK
jgi:hypothetical protein